MSDYISYIATDVILCCLARFHFVVCDLIWLSDICGYFSYASFDMMHPEADDDPGRRRHSLQQVNPGGILSLQ